MVKGSGRIAPACLATVLVLGSATAQAQAPAAQAPTTPSSPASPAPSQAPFEPTVGQAGKDVVWVPTPPALVEKMLDMANVTPDDFVMDLGSGDGRNIIAAAKRGATAVGVEFNPEMVALSRKSAEAAGVAGKATFVQGDMYEADISRATVLALFLLPHNLDKLVPKFLALPAGTRIVGNTFSPAGWAADESETISGDCTSWCTSLLWIVPAKAAGKWKVADGELDLGQEFQIVSGTLTSGAGKTEVKGKLRGDVVTLYGDNLEYTGRITGDTIEGTVKTTAGMASPWRATRAE